MNDVITVFDNPFIFLFEDVTEEDLQKAKDELTSAKKEWRKKRNMGHVSAEEYDRKDPEWYRNHSAYEIADNLREAEKCYESVLSKYKPRTYEPVKYKPRTYEPAKYNNQVKDIKSRERSESIDKMKDDAVKKKDGIISRILGMKDGMKKESSIQGDAVLTFEFANLFLTASNDYDMILALESDGYSFGENKELLFSLMERVLMESGEYFIEAESIENINAQLYEEAALSSKIRNKLDDSEFGLPEDRSYPLIDEKHVRSAIQYFNKCEKSKQKLLAKNILNAMKKFDMLDKVKVSESNEFYKYYKERERYMKENFDLRPFPRLGGAMEEFSVGAMIPQIPLTGSTLDKSPDCNVSMYDKVEILDELSEDPREIGKFDFEESVLESLENELDFYTLESVVFESEKIDNIIETIKQKFKELIQKLNDALTRYLSNGEEQKVEEDLKDIQERYPKILKDHPELANIDLSDHFHDTSLSVRDTARYERETNALIDKYIKTNMSDEKFNREFDKIRKRFVSERKQVFTYNVKTSGEPTGKIILRGVLNALPTIINLTVGAVLIKEARGFVEDISKKFETGAIKSVLEKGGDLGKKATEAVKVATTVSKDLVEEAKNNEKIKKTVKRAMREAKGMKKFYGDIGKKIVKTVTKESTDTYINESQTDIDLMVSLALVSVAVTSLAIPAGGKYLINKNKLNKITKYFEKTDEKFIPYSKLKKERRKLRHDVTAEDSARYKDAFYSGKKINSLKTKLLNINSAVLLSYNNNPIFVYGIDYDKQDHYNDTFFYNMIDRSFSKYELYYVACICLTEGIGVSQAYHWIEDTYDDIQNEMKKESADDLYMEASLPFVKKNIVFDSELKKIVDKLKEFTSTSEVSSEKLISKGMNFKRTVCTLKLKQSEDGKINPKVISAIKSLGFKEIEDEGIKSIYEKEVKGILITLTYDEVMDKIKITYENTIQNVHESSDNVYMESVNYDMYSMILADEYQKIQKDIDKANISTPRKTHARIVLDENYKKSQDFFIRMKSDKGLKTKFDRFIDRNGKLSKEQISDLFNSALLISDKELRDLKYKEARKKRSDEKSKTEFWSNANRTLENIVSLATTLGILGYAANALFNESSNNYVSEAAEIDDDMKSILETLHRKGYRTKYSCAGHTKTRIKEDGFRDGVYNGKLYSTARIVFATSYKNIDTAPKGWCRRDLENGRSSIYVKPKSYMPKDGNPDEAFLKWKSEYMASLKTWVEELPDSDNYTEESTIEDIERDIFDDLI